MYSKSFYITGIVGNNAFSFGQRKNRKLYVPSLRKISSFDEIELQDDFTKVAFEDFNFDGIISTNYGLKNFYEIVRPQFNYPSQANGKQSIFLFDNHNHALFFWYLARSRSIIGDNNILYHVDEHADTRDPGEDILKPDSYDLEKVFQYTNFSKINVGNYIIPAQKEGLIGEVIQIRNEMNLLETKNRKIKKKNGRGIILNLDLDFFQPNLDFINYNLKKKIILDIAEKADLITIATSPFFIKQELALTVFKDLFDNK